MKVPTQSCSPATSKPLSGNNTALNTTFQAPNSTPNINSNNNSNPSCYEPTSVLDLQRSPSPAANAARTTTNNRQKPPSVDLDNLEGWDSILTELGLNDDSNPNSKLWSQITPGGDSHSHLPQLPDFPSSQPLDQTPTPISFPSDYNISDLSYGGGQNLTPNFGQFDLHLHQPNVVNNNNYFGIEFIEDLIRAAQAFESNDSHQVQLILARLNQRLRSPAGKPLHRAAFYFKEALQHLATSAGPARPARLSSYEVVQTIRAHKAFSGISPISLFSTFAANQAILEAVDDGSAFIHIVDFDIGFGGHWASFMRELVDKADRSEINSIVLRITAIVPEEFGIESKLVRENLSQFARDLNINFHMDYVLIQSFEILSFKSVKLIDGEKLAVHLSPAVFHRLGGISKFVADLRGISPCTVVVVDREVGIDTATSSFSVNFVSGIEFYTGVLESLDVTSAGGFVGGGEAVRRIETFVLKPRIVAAVEAAAEAGRRRTWREEFAAARMKPVGFSQFADFQAECLLKRAQVGGFHVAKRHWEMMLCWHDRPLVSTSAWKC